MGMLALAQEVLSEEKHAWRVGRLNNSANRCRVKGYAVGCYLRHGEFPRRILLETVWKVLRTSQPPDHEPRHRRVDKCLSGGAQPLVVFGHPPVVADPREGALHHPPPRQHCETSRGQKLLPVHLLAFFGPLLCPELGYLLREWLSRLAHDLDAQTQYLLGPPSAPSSVAGIDP